MESVVNPTARLVPPEGPRTAQIAFIGEAPGSLEERQLRPFVGQAGQLLDQLLAQAGIIRSECYLTNVVKERPHNNDISTFINLSRKEPRITKAGQAYIDALLDELKDIEANVLVPLGNVPLWVLTGEKGITKRRGSMLTGLDGRKVIPVIHPAAALRQYLFRFPIAHDLQLIKGEAKSAKIELPKRNLIIRPEYIQVLAYLNACLQSFRVAFDIETTNLEVNCISFARTPDDAISIPFAEKGKHYFTEDEEMTIWLLIAQILESPAIMKVAQNGVFDASFLFRKYGIRTWPIEDTMISHAVLFPELPKGLDFLTSVYTREPYFKDEGKVWKNPWGDMNQFWAYNAKDSAVCLEVLSPIQADLDRLGNTEVAQHQTKLIPPIMYMQERGIRVDHKALKSQSVKMGSEIKVLEAELHELCGYDINPRSPKQVGEYFYIKKGLTPYVKRGARTWTTDENALKRIARKGFREASVILDIRKLVKIKGTYLDVPLDEDHRLRCAYKPVGTKSGRLSSAANIFGTGTNLQNIPKHIRRHFLSDSGFVAYEVDLSQAENRIVAFIAPEPTMWKAFNEGVDVHALTASIIFGVPVAEVSSKAGSSSLSGGRYSQRHWGKKTNHGFNYDWGYKAFALENELPEAEGRRLRSVYFEMYPGVKQWHRSTQHKLSKDRTLTNLLGRSRKFLDRWGDELFREAYSFVPQSTCADLLNRFGLRFVYERQDLFEFVELLNQVHDSLWLQIPLHVGWEYHAAAISALCASLATPLTHLGESFSIPSDVNLGLNFYGDDMVTISDPTNPQEYENAYVQASQAGKQAQEEAHTNHRNDSSGVVGT